MCNISRLAKKSKTELGQNNGRVKLLLSLFDGAINFSYYVLHMHYELELKVALTYSYQQ